MAWRFLGLEMEETHSGCRSVDKGVFGGANNSPLETGVLWNITQGLGAGCCQYSKEASGTIKSAQFPD
jgi:hypothetical protein